jgi:hypothetical protein
MISTLLLVVLLAAPVVARIPTEAGRVFRREAGQGSGLKPATIPI